MGINLTADKAVAARRAWLRSLLDVLVFNGNAEKSIAGFKIQTTRPSARFNNNTAANWTDADKFMKMVLKSCFDWRKRQPNRRHFAGIATQFAMLATSFVSSGANYLHP